MAVFNEPAQWDHTLGNNADASTLPDDSAATAGTASLQKLFQIINATPLEAGGIAPDREDVNALFKYLGDQIFYTQNGGVPSYNPAYDYIPGRVILYTDNKLYKCIQANGASSTVVAPDSVTPLGSDYWKDIENQDNTSLIPNQLIVSPVPLTDANLHLLDGALLSGDGAYADYVTMMGELYTADPTATCWTDEATWQTSVTTYGECGKFVYNSVNNTLRLPKLASFVQATSTASELGTLVEAGAPNITGQLLRISETWENHGIATGAFTKNSGYDANGTPSVTDSSPSGAIIFNASNSNSIYGNSNTIQPQAIKYYFYIVVGTISKTDIQIDIDQILTDLNGKADIDLTNAVPTSAFANALNNANIRTVVETYQNGKSWYRVYSDNWCEQGGEVVPASADTVWNLIKPFADTNYVIVGSDCQETRVSENSFAAYSTTQFKIGTSGHGNYTKAWFACGYIS